jgi:hypothetical protein
VGEFAPYWERFMSKKLTLIVGILIFFILPACAPLSRLFTTPTPTATATSTSTPTLTPKPTLTRTPTNVYTKTPSPTPTWSNRYRALVSDEVAKVMDTAFLGLKKAAQTNDREYLANMINYPIWVDAGGKSIWIETKQDFFNNFDKIYPPHVLEVLSNITLDDDYIFASWRGIWLLHHDDIGSVQIFFTNEFNGKIDGIDYWGSFNEGTPDNSTYTLTPQPKTATPTFDPKVSSTPTLTATPYWFPTTKPNMNSVFSYFGTWTITSFMKIDTFYCENPAYDPADFIGQSIELLPDTVKRSEGFLNDMNTELVDINYVWMGMGWVDKYFYMLPDDYFDKQTTTPVLVIMQANKYVVYKAQITKSDRLVLQDGCYFYFLDKVPPSTSSE